MLPCRRFADVLADACARLGADVDRYSFIEVDLHHKLLAGLPAHSLALRPAHSRRHLYVTSYTEGFSHFVTSMTAPVASGWSVRRVGLAPTGKRRLLTAHANTGRWADGSANGLTNIKSRHNFSTFCAGDCEAELSALCRRRARPVDSRSSGECRQADVLIGRVSCRQLLGRNLMLFKQPVVGILGAAAFVVVGLFMPKF